MAYSYRGNGKILSIPRELFTQVVKGLSQTDLCRLALSCKQLATELEDFRYTDITLRSASAIASFQQALQPQTRDSRQRLRTDKVISLRLTWHAGGQATPGSLSIYDCLYWFCNNLPSLVTLAIQVNNDIPPEDNVSMPPRLSLLAISPIRRLWISPIWLRKIATIPPTLTCLTINTAAHSLPTLCVYIVRVFADKLRRLRLFRTFEHGIHNESPVRICSILYRQSLEYLEVRDNVAPSRDDLYGISDHFDFSFNPESKHRAPSLRQLVWVPVWHGETADCYQELRNSYCHKIARSLHDTAFYLGFGDGSRALKALCHNGKVQVDSEVKLNEDWWSVEPTGRDKRGSRNGGHAR